jgi:peptidoglycan hydrolase CwlO-like protein
MFILFVFSGHPLSTACAAEQTRPADILVVDFTNDEARSISVRLGSADGIAAWMNFAVLDSTNGQIAAFYPHEILSDRFWSGPLASSDYAKVRSGSTVIRVSLSTEDAAQLREQFGLRSAALKKEQRRRRIDELGVEKRELEDLLNDVDVELVDLSNELQSLSLKLKREEDLVQRKVANLQERIRSLSIQRSDLADDRGLTLDKRGDLLKLKDPPHDRIRDLNGDIADLDRDIGRINIQIKDLREEVRGLRQETSGIRGQIHDVQEQQRELQAKRTELERELENVEKDIEILEQGRPY